MLKQIVESLSKDEIRSIKLYLNRTNERNERKDVQLLDLLRKNSRSDTQMCQDLYQGKKNPYYRLKNRLKEDIGRSLLSQHHKSSSEQEVINHYLISKLFSQKRLYIIAEHYLKLAERKAEKTLHYELLELVYSEQLKLSQETLHTNPEGLIRRRQNNRKKIRQINEFDDLLAVLSYKIRVSQNYSNKSDNTITNLLQQTIEDYSSEEMLRENPAIRFRIYQGVSKILVQNQDFQSLEEYLHLTYSSFLRDQLFRKENHETKLQMLVYLSNALFKNEHYQSSLEYAENLLEAMREFNYLLYDKYLFYYYNALYYNYSVLDKQKAIKILLEASEEPAIIKEPLNFTFVTLQLVVYYFNDREFQLANGQVERLLALRSFPNLDQAFQLKIRILDVMISLETLDFNRAESQLRKAMSTSSESSEKRDLLFMDLLRHYLQYGREKTEAYKTTYSRFVLTSSENDLIPYADWIQQKMGG